MTVCFEIFEYNSQTLVKYISTCYVKGHFALLTVLLRKIQNTEIICMQISVL